MRARLLALVLLAPPLALALAGSSGCSDGSYIVVTVETRPAVAEAARLRVTLSNAGSMRTEDIELDGAKFPATFSISPEDRTGDLGISIDAVDEGDVLVGRGETASSVGAASARVVLDPTDFVVNTEYAEDQQLSNYVGSNGFQLAATPDGQWTAVYNAQCSTPCNVFGRRFDANARPLNSTAAAGTQGFPISAQLTTSFSTPAVATDSTGATTLVVWNNHVPATTTYSIQCRALDNNGAATTTQTLISTDEFPNIVSHAPLSNGNFVVTWDGQVTSSMVRSAIVRPDCSVVGAVAQVSQNAAGLSPDGSHSAANGQTILYAWTLSGSVRVRTARNDGSFMTVDTELVAATAQEEVLYLRVAPLGTGFGVFVRWALSASNTGPGRIDLYRVSPTGTIVGMPTKITDRSGSDFESSGGFGLAPRSDGSVLVVWSSCGDKGDGSGCGVFGRLVRPDGTPTGDELNLATTTTEDQVGPSAVALPDGAFAVAWTDHSHAAPDTSGTAVRARILYPPAIAAPADLR